MLGFIMQDMTDALQYTSLGLVIAAVICILVYVRNYNRKRGHIPYVALFLLIVYLVTMSYIIFLNREPGSRDEVTFKLFGTLGYGARGNAYVIENILLFIPYGLLLPYIWSGMRRPAICCLSACLCSIAIETLQYIAKRGYCQLDDVVFNTIGALLGYLFFRLLYRIPLRIC